MIGATDKETAVDEPKRAQFGPHDGSVMRRRPPMEAWEAYENLCEMVHGGTSIKAQRRLLEYALGPIGNLSVGAREVYAARLAQIKEES